MLKSVGCAVVEVDLDDAVVVVHVHVDGMFALDGPHVGVVAFEIILVDSVSVIEI